MHVLVLQSTHDNGGTGTKQGAQADNAGWSCDVVTVGLVAVAKNIAGDRGGLVEAGGSLAKAFGDLGENGRGGVAALAEEGGGGAGEFRRLARDSRGDGVDAAADARGDAVYVGAQFGCQAVDGGAD